jgi:hypothetical protein
MSQISAACFPTRRMTLLEADRQWWCSFRLSAKASRPNRHWGLTDAL